MLDIVDTGRDDSCTQTCVSRWLQPDGRLMDKAFDRAICSDGLMKRWVLCVIQITQVYAICQPARGEAYTDFKFVSSWSLGILGLLKNCLGLNNFQSMEEQFLFLTVSLTLCFLYLNYSFHTNTLVAFGVLAALAVFSTLCDCLACLSAVVVCFVVVLVLGILHRSGKLPGTLMNTSSQCMGDGVVESRERSVSVTAHIFIACVWFSTIVISGVRQIWAAFASVLLFSVGVTCLILYMLKCLMASMHDIRQLVFSVYYFYSEIAYIPAIYHVVSLLRTGNNKSWILITFSTLFCVILPVLQKILAAFQVRRLFRSLSDEEYYNVLDNSNVVYMSIFSGLKRTHFWWPSVEMAMRITYCILSMLGYNDTIWTLSIIFVFVIILVRPCREWCDFVILMGEALIVLLLNYITIRPHDTWSVDYEYNISAYLFIVPIIPLVASFIVFAHLKIRYTPAYKAELVNQRVPSSNKKVCRSVSLLRSSFGLSANNKLESYDDIPVFMSEREFIESYEGPSRGISIDIARMSKDESDQTIKSHAPLDCDPYSLNKEVKDADLPRKLLIQRVECATTAVMNRLYSYMFPMGLVFFVMYAKIWFKYQKHRM